MKFEMENEKGSWLKKGYTLLGSSEHYDTYNDVLEKMHEFLENLFQFEDKRLCASTVSHDRQGYYFNYYVHY